MNKKVLKVMIGLVVVFLLALYLLKFAFPEMFVIAVENKTFIEIGNYIDSHDWSYYLFGICTAFITYWFYFCAVFKKWYLNWIQALIVLGIVGASIGLSFVDPQLTTAFTICAMLLIPLIFKADMTYGAIVFSIHYLAQALTLSIREVNVMYGNTLIFTLLTIECFFWLLLFYLIPHIKSKEV